MSTFADMSEFGPIPFQPFPVRLRPDGFTVVDDPDEESSGSPHSFEHDRLDQNINAESPEFGTNLSIQDVYREKEGAPWKTTVPEGLLQLDTNLSHREFALIARRQMQQGDEPRMGLHSVVIQSPFLRRVMRETFHGYQGIATQLKRVVFRSPFHEFVHRWGHYLARVESETDKTTKAHLDLFNSVIKPEITPHLEQRKELLEHQIVTYAQLWMLFEPNIDIYKSVQGYDHVYHLVQTDYGLESFDISCRFVNWDGASFGYQHTDLHISMFKGYKSIQELGVIPVEYHPQKEELKRHLAERGRHFEAFKGFHYMTYSGRVFYKAQYGWDLEHLESGRIIIDAETFGLKNPGAVADLDPLDTDALLTKCVDHDSDTETSDQQAGRSLISGRTKHGDRRIRHGRTPTQSTIPDAADKNFSALDPHHHIYCTPILKGYCLATRRWARFYIDRISPIKWNASAFCRLILPHDFKDLILAVVNSHIARTTSFDDVIEGKGRGIIILLHGEPGVGKTLTAEAVAEEIQKPLYSMSAGELGWDAGSVEQTLRSVLEICARWKAVLLLDECDVFLEQRTVSDLQRNKLVSIFLRMLEYYKGVLFLTTNRVASFDKAFQSRIDLNISYPSLDFESKKHIWRTFATSSPEFPQNMSNLQDGDLSNLARLNMNGREIKNVVKTGRLLAEWKKEVLSGDHLRTALRVHNKAIGHAQKGETHEI